MDRATVPDGDQDALHLRHKVLVFNPRFMAHRSSQSGPRLTLRHVNIFNSSNNVLPTKIKVQILKMLIVTAQLSRRRDQTWLGDPGIVGRLPARGKELRSAQIAATPANQFPIQWVPAD
jgi:hypothetical protein